MPADARHGGDALANGFAAAIGTIGLAFVVPVLAIGLALYASIVLLIEGGRLLLAWCRS